MQNNAQIPEFEAKVNYPYSVLPHGVYECDDQALRDRFVRRFPESLTRLDICDGFLRLRAEITLLGLAATQWVDGSFVESKPDPDDVDVVSFCDYDDLNRLVVSLGQAFVQLLGGQESTKATYRTHTFLVPSCPPGHPYHRVFEASRRYWRNWLGKTREIPDPPGPDLPGHPKGFLRMALGTNPPAIETGRNVP